jgi:hypothetical protein
MYHPLHIPQVHNVSFTYILIPKADALTIKKVFDIYMIHTHKNEAN